MRQLRNEMDRLFGEIGRPRAAAFPPVDIWTSQDGVVVTAELPGVDPSELEISAMRDTLTIRGERRAPVVDANRSWHRRERGTGKFSRTIELPHMIDTDSVDASCRDGVLRIGLKRPEAEKPRRIEVRSS
jgi:HSP20 family protein